MRRLYNEYEAMTEEGLEIDYAFSIICRDFLRRHAGDDISLRDLELVLLNVVSGITSEMLLCAAMETRSKRRIAERNEEQAAATNDGYVFKVGNSYRTQEGMEVRVTGRTPDAAPGYETVECTDGSYRYDRHKQPLDAGRVCGTAHDYADPRNFLRLSPRQGE